MGPVSFLPSWSVGPTRLGRVMAVVGIPLGPVGGPILRLGSSWGLRLACLDFLGQPAGRRPGRLVQAIVFSQTARQSVGKLHHMAFCCCRRLATSCSGCHLAARERWPIGTC